MYVIGKNFPLMKKIHGNEEQNSCEIQTKYGECVTYFTRHFSMKKALLRSSFFSFLSQRITGMRYHLRIHMCVLLDRSHSDSRENALKLER